MTYFNIWYNVNFKSFWQQQRQLSLVQWTLFFIYYLIFTNSQPWDHDLYNFFLFGLAQQFFLPSNHRICHITAILTGYKVRSHSDAKNSSNTCRTKQDGQFSVNSRSTNPNSLRGTKHKRYGNKLSGPPWKHWQSVRTRKQHFQRTLKNWHEVMWWHKQQHPQLWICFIYVLSKN